MNHFVWPALWRGVIRTASKVHTDHPEWWYQGIVPILQHPDVFSLYYKGGKRMASRSWGYVCAQLASHNFAEQDAAEPFTQKTVSEFVADAGYVKAAAAEEDAATEAKLATTSKAASIVCCSSKAASVAVHQLASAAGAVEPPPGVWTLRGDVDAAPAASALSRDQKAHLQAQVARRYAYSQLDQHARRTIASAEWCWLSSPSDCVNIREAFATYQDSNEFTRKLLDVKAVVAEIRLTVQYFSQRRLWPV